MHLRIDAEEARQIRSDIADLGIDADLLSFQLHSLGVSGRKGRMDAGESLLFQRSLLYVSKVVREQKYPELKARNFIPVDSSVPTGAEAFSWTLRDYTGMAKIGDDNADDLPTVESFADEKIQGIKTISDGFSWNIQDLRAAAYSGVPLETYKAQAARMAMERSLEAIASAGVGPLPGMLNNGSVPIVVNPAITGAWTGGVTTPLQVLADLHYIANYANRTTIDAYTVDTLLLPIAQFQYVKSTLINPAGQADQTILEAFLASNNYIKNVDSWGYLSTAGSGGVTRAVAYKRDPMAVGLVIPQPFEMLPPQPKNMKLFVPCRMRCGGVTVYMPLSFVYADGI